LRKHFLEEDTFMRAITGAIITAGALIGLGLVSIGIGTRYQSFAERDVDGHPMWVRMSQMDSPLMLVLVMLVMATIIGMGVAFIGLAFHHERRHYERHGQAMDGTSATRESVMSSV
jgi:hypothetical protein